MGNFDHSTTLKRKVNRTKKIDGIKNSNIKVSFLWLGLQGIAYLSTECCWLYVIKIQWNPDITDPYVTKTPRVYELYFPTVLVIVQKARETSTNIPRYCTFGYCTVSCCTVPCARSSCYTCSFSFKLLKEVEKGWVVYFYSLFVFWLALRVRYNTAQLVKIYGDTSYRNI